MPGIQNRGSMQGMFATWVVSVPQVRVGTPSRPQAAGPAFVPPSLQCDHFAASPFANKAFGKKEQLVPGQSTNSTFSIGLLSVSLSINPCICLSIYLSIQLSS